MINPVAPYRYLLANMYLFMADIANPDVIGCCCRTWISFVISCFYEEQCHPAGLHGRLPNKTKHREGWTQFAPGLTDRCDSSTACKLCRIISMLILLITNNIKPTLISMTDHCLLTRFYLQFKTKPITCNKVEFEITCGLKTCNV